MCLNEKQFGDWFKLKFMSGVKARLGLGVVGKLRVTLIQNMSCVNRF
ncbi:hypothetical protein MED222_05355 [Vibrio sp. MED222]|nr:hypothetical protein MED222_05355 [Vibrio sp. MED222]